jgi:exosortase
MNAEATDLSQPLQDRWTGWIWLLTLAGVWFWTFRSMALWWNYAPAYGYGYAVPWIALFLAWQRFRRNPGCLDLSPSRGAAMTGVFLPCAAWGAFLFSELLRQIDPMWRPVNWVFTVAATVLTFSWAYRRGGRALIRQLAFPILFTWTALPWPGFLDDPLTMKLRAIVTVLTVNALHGMGIHAVQQVNVIWLDNGPVGVEDACSGIVSFHSSLMVALFLGEFLRLGWLRRTVLIAGACVIAVGGNLLRTLALCWYVQRDGIGAVAVHHDRLGFYSSVAIFVTVFALAWLLARLKAREQEILAPPEIALRLFADARFGVGGAVSALVAFAIVPVLGPAWFAVRPSGGAQVQETPLWAMRPQAAPAGWRIEPIELLESQKATLGFTVGEAFLVQDARGATLQVYHFFWGAERSGLPYAHTPDICMSYIGWTQPGPARNVTLALRGTGFPARSFRFQREGQEITALYTFWRGGEPGITGNELLDNRKLARLPLLLSGPRLFGMEEILVFVTAPGDEAARVQLAGEVLGKIISRMDTPEPPATAAR